MPMIRSSVNPNPSAAGEAYANDKDMVQISVARGLCSSNIDKTKYDVGNVRFVKKPSR
jgi:hypothetical protein